MAINSNAERSAKGVTKRERNTKLGMIRTGSSARADTRKPGAAEIAAFSKCRDL